jgi:CxxC motif-containing protein (DUF1111 family)
MHDGRAETLVDAIAMHGGQGAASATAFHELPGVDKKNLIAFLETLTAPGGVRAAPEVPWK